MIKDKPILVTGIIRSGTTWVGRVLATCERTLYIHELMNPSSPWNSCFPTPIAHYYLNNDIGGPFVFLLDRLANLKPVIQGEWRQEIRSERNMYISKNTKKYIIPRLILKDPTALFSANWFSENFNSQVVVVLRHPVSIIKSILKLGWAKGFNSNVFKKQPFLLKEFFLNANSKDIEIINGNWKNYSEVNRAIYFVRLLYLAICKYFLNKTNFIFISYENFIEAPLDNFMTLFDQLSLTPSVASLENLKKTKQYDNDKKHQNTSIPIVNQTNDIYKDEYGLENTKSIYVDYFSDVRVILKDIVDWDK